nr:DUF5058 family protein [Acidaminobacter sp. JC074]
MFLYLVSGIFILFVIIQALFFLIRAYREGVSTGMDKKTLNRTIKSSIAFSIAPAISILLGVITLSKFLGLPLPWLRLSILGAITYELTAAASAASTMGIQISEAITSPQTYVTILWVMTLGIIPSMVIIPLFLKKFQSGMSSIKNKDPQWSEHFMTAIFLGMISAFLGVVFKDITSGIVGFIPVFVMMFSALVMVIIGLILKVYRYKALEDYALPISMLSGMVFSIVITRIIGG